MKIYRYKVYELIAKSRLNFSSQDEIIEFLEDYTIDSHNVYDAMLDAISSQYLGVSNGFLSDIYETITGSKAEVIGDIFELFRCPCCGFKTLSEIYDLENGTGYDICDFCNWEDDGTTDIEVVRSINKGSILEYRKKIQMENNKYYKNKWLK